LLDKVKRNAFFIAAVFFLWQGWSSATAAPDLEEEEKEKSSLIVPSIRGNFLRGADPEETADPPEDPFGLLSKALEKQAAAMQQLGVNDSNLPTDSVPEASSSQLMLRLESTMHANHTWIARINGHMLRVGDTLPGFDENQPPVLVSVEGTLAQLRYDGQLIVLDLSGEASVSVN